MLPQSVRRCGGDRRWQAFDRLKTAAFQKSVAWGFSREQEQQEQHRQLSSSNRFAAIRLRDLGLMMSTGDVGNRNAAIVQWEPDPVWSVWSAYETELRRNARSLLDGLVTITRPRPTRLDR